jgi:hypothetical protein
VSLYEVALESHRWNSMQPERRAEQCVAEVEQHMAETEALFMKAGGSPEDVAAELAAYRTGYIKRYRAWLAARGRTASVMVTGAANFPAARNRKRMDVEQRRYQELADWSEKARRAARKRLRPEVDPQHELKVLEGQLAAMKAVNRIIRRDISDEEKVAAMVAELSWKETTAREALEPDFCGRVGFPSHSLASVRDKMKRLKAKMP